MPKVYTAHVALLLCTQVVRERREKEPVTHCSYVRAESFNSYRTSASGVQCEAVGRHLHVAVHVVQSLFSVLGQLITPCACAAGAGLSASLSVQVV